MRRFVFILASSALTLTVLRGADDKTIADLKQKAALGDAVSEARLGEAYVYGLGGLTRDYAQGLALFQKAAAQNNSEGEADMGWLYEKGYGVPQDEKQAFQWFTKGANAGNAYGQVELGNCYGAGWGVTKDRTLAVAWYTKAAQQGNDEAMTRLGLALQQGAGIPVDLRQGFTYLLRAGYDNFGWAQYCLSGTYSLGQFVSKDLIEAERWALLASRNGYNNSDESKMLVWLADKMTPEQFGEAQVLVKNWDRERMGDIQPVSAAVIFAANQRALIPLQDADNELLVNATINGHSNLKFWIDTGCNFSIIDQKSAAALGLSAGSTYRPVSGIGPNVMLMSRVNRVDLRLLGVSFLGVNFEETSTSDWDSLFGFHTDGILGADLLKHLVVRIDYIHRTIELIDPKVFKPTQEMGTALPATCRDQCLLVTGIIGNNGAFSPPTAFPIDTGDDSAVNLTRNFIEANRALGIKGGAASEVGGIGGTLTTSTVKVSQLKLGSIIIAGPAAELAGTNQGGLVAMDGVIGNGILRRFDVTIDYPGSKLFLKPNAQFNDPFFYANSGLTVFATGLDFRTYVVHDVAPDTAGARAGFKVGDVVTHFDSLMLSTQDDRQARQLFRKPGHHSVVVTRDGKPVTLDFNCDYISASKTGT